MKLYFTYTFILFVGAVSALPPSYLRRDDEQKINYTACKEEVDKDQPLYIDLTKALDNPDTQHYEFDGDLEIPKVMLEDSEDGLSRNIMLYDQFLWPQGRMEYVIDPYAGFGKLIAGKRNIIKG